MRKKSILSMLVVTLVLLTFVPSGMAYVVDITRVNGYFSGNGGEFTIGGLGPVLPYYDAKAKDIGKIGTFESFCLELGIAVTIPGTYNATIDNVAISGGPDYGNGDPGTDPISIGTAWLYMNFAKGMLSGYDYTPGAGRSASALELQTAIWWLEDELTQIGQNDFIDLLYGTFGATFNPKADNNQYPVMALNLWDMRTGADKQSQLVLTPIPGALFLLGPGLLGLVGLRRRILG